MNIRSYTCIFTVWAKPAQRASAHSLSRSYFSVQVFDSNNASYGAEYFIWRTLLILQAVRAGSLHPLTEQCVLFIALPCPV